ncbi:peptide/nickel transport system ATP-binding protein/oligopeptide transport system ATP-binding protein [Rhizobium petrolearium]|uniref:ABC transporter ATP-binding protein n=1 Tax=Neorhizobium petrolearium TaxID=515361 RepID=UPI001AE536ED|nr:oligopeptide/dipeptide ABC transporter ATP-binding protein [Neorhizobium petrolearium]MBP1844237.1 peptide/nickel transport system ATP-binding protein/oligopeptide transport system ATP-binding protein [Neorhizobium petrolearium]
MNEVVSSGQTALKADNLHVSFGNARRGSLIRAVDGVSFSVRKGEIFGVIGESGSGKSTLGRCLVGLLSPSGGGVLHGDVDPFKFSRRELNRHRRKYQIVSQDPNAAFDPRMTILQSVCEPADIAGEGTKAERRKKAFAMLDRVALSPELANRYPHEISGGQKQRANIARALMLDPTVIVCDEVVAALDVSIQADMLNLFSRLQEQLGLTYVFISHDLRVVSHISDRVAVMYFGKIVEFGPAHAVIDTPLHPYTEALRSAEPEVNPAAAEARQRIILQGEIPSAISPPSGCRFHTRCPRVRDICRTQEPQQRELLPGRHVACHFAEEMLGEKERRGLGPAGRNGADRGAAATQMPT